MQHNMDFNCTTAAAAAGALVDASPATATLIAMWGIIYYVAYNSAERKRDTGHPLSTDVDAAGTCNIFTLETKGL